MPSLSAPAAKLDADPAVVAAAWFAHFALSSLAAMPREEAVPQRPLAVLAAFAAIALAEGRTLVILAPDDQQLPEISNALDLAIRPLCLVLPAADFAARIALRATLSLMRSRLARDGEDEQVPAWQRQRERIAKNEALWQEAHRWVARNDRSEWPEQVADLFPARILPIEAYRSLRQKSSDITLLYRCDAPPELIAPPGSLLHVGTRAETPRHRSIVVGDADLQLRMELAQLTQDVAELELELATAQAEVAEFTRRYYELVGRRMVELDAIQARLAREQAERDVERQRKVANQMKSERQADEAAERKEQEQLRKASGAPSQAAIQQCLNTLGRMSIDASRRAELESGCYASGRLEPIYNNGSQPVYYGGTYYRPPHVRPVHPIAPVTPPKYGKPPDLYKVPSAPRGTR